MIYWYSINQQRLYIQNKNGYFVYIKMIDPVSNEYYEYSHWSATLDTVQLIGPYTWDKPNIL